MILVSACLCGVNCRYDGADNNIEIIHKLLKEGAALPVCPEQLGGLATPRIACEIQGGTGVDVLDKKAKVINKANTDLSENFIRGAEETLKLALATGVTKAVFKSRSPSCGAGQVYDGSFKSKLIPGDGVTTALLKKHGIEVITAEEFSNI